MKKFITLFLSSCLICSLVGCGNATNEEETSTAIVEENKMEEEETTTPSEDKVHTVRVNGINYYDTNRTIGTIEEATEETITGDIRSFVNSDEFPNEDNQSNFGVGYQYQVKDEEFIYVNINGEWHIFCSNEDGENVVTFHDRVFLKTELSNDTLEWLENYNSLTEEEQMATSYIPAELIDEVLVDIEETDEAGDQEVGENEEENEQDAPANETDEKTEKVE